MPRQSAENGTSVLQNHLLIGPEPKALNLGFLVLTLSAVEPGPSGPGFALWEVAMNARAGFLLHVQNSLACSSTWFLEPRSFGQETSRGKPSRTSSGTRRTFRPSSAIHPGCGRLRSSATWLSVAEKDFPPNQQIGGGLRQMPNAGTRRRCNFLARLPTPRFASFSGRRKWSTSPVLRCNLDYADRFDWPPGTSCFCF